MYNRVVLALCGGNIDTTVLGRCLDRGLTADGRLLKFSVVASDRPGGIAELCRLLADVGVSIKDILHERAWIDNDVFSVKVTSFLAFLIPTVLSNFLFLVINYIPFLYNFETS